MAEKSFNQSTLRIDEILGLLASPETEVDSMFALVEEATEHLLYCQNLLTHTEHKIASKLSQLESLQEDHS